MRIFSSLTRNQKESIALLQIGTFLEYFDLMLYVHMAIILDELFFPKVNPYTASLITAFTFCSTYLLRPLGALLFGWIGDNIGRKATVLITTFMMAISCIIMANLPTYAQIGSAAMVIMLGCRIVQGLSSMGEMIGAQIYVTEMTKPPIQYTVMGLIGLAASVGGTFALAVGFLVTKTNLNWRLAFWIGAGIAFFGTLARTMLKETPEFIDAKRHAKLLIEKNSVQVEEKNRKRKKIRELVKQQGVNNKTLLAYFLTHCGYPLTFYLTYFYFNPILKNSFGYKGEDIIYHNLILSLFVILSDLFWSFLTYKVNPLQILKFRGWCFFAFSLLLPILISKASNGDIFLAIQAFFIIAQLGYFPACSIFIKHFPVLKRFRWTSILYALTRMFMYALTSFGLVFLTEWFGHLGIILIAVPITIAYLWGIKHFETLEQKDKEREEEDRKVIMKLKHAIQVF